MLQGHQPDLLPDEPSTGQGQSRLPPQLTSLIGRQSEIRAVLEAFSRARLITLTGSAGAGKTRLGLEVARRLEEAEGKPAWFVDLAPLREPRLVEKAVIAALGGREETGREPVETITGLLHTQASVLMLDNCEHLLEAAAELARRLLELAPDLVLLATSRAPLGVHGEARWPVPPLTEEDAARLFADRARLVAPDFELSRQTTLVVTEICRRLDGMPLAIELAAARAGQMPPEEILDRLHARLRLLTHTARGLPARHQTLRAALDWSYDLLDPGDQRLFAQLSVFASGLSPIAAQAVAGADLNALARLVDWSLLVPRRSVEGRARYRLLESLREYARDRLQASPEAAATARRHFEHFASFALAAGPELHGRDQTLWMDRLEEEHDNLRAALDWGREHDPEVAIDMAAAIAWFWNAHGHYMEGARRLRELLAAAPFAGKRTRSAGLTALGRLALNLADKSEAGPALDESVDLWRRLGDAGGLALALLSKAMLISWQGGPVEVSMTLLEEALERARQAGDRHQEALALAWMGRLGSAAPDRQLGTARLLDAITLERELGDHWALGFTLHSLAHVRWQLGDLDGAEAHNSEALELYKKLQEPAMVAHCNAFGGELALARGDLAVAQRRFETALTLEGITLREPGAVNGLAGLAAAQRLYSRALRLHGAAEAMPPSVVSRIGRLDEQSWFRGAISALGAKAAQAMWEEGKRLPPEEAISYALSDAGQPPVGGGPLTRRECEIAAFVAAGLRNREIAEKLFIAPRTVDAHVEHIRNKLGYSSRAQIAAWAAANGVTVSGSGIA